MFTRKKQESETPKVTVGAGVVQESDNGKGVGDVLVAVHKTFFDRNEREIKKVRPILNQINAFDFSQATDEELKSKSEELKQRFRDRVAARLRDRDFDPDRQVDEWLADPADDEYLRSRRSAEESTLTELLPEAFALVREVASRTIQLRPFDVQCLGGIVLHQGKIAEMKTGEGKTLTATMPVYLNALTGRGVHLVTVNDYLAERDANWMRPVYEFLGLKVAYITNNTPPPERRLAYNSDILYVTNSEVGFDYLRDNMANSREYLVQRPLNYGIVDEVDNILIDEARTPLIISAQVELSDRARKRRSLAKLCDLVARKVMPATTDQEVKKLIERHTRDNKISVDGLMEFLRKQGCLEAGLNYLIDCFLASESSARAQHVGKLVDALAELRQRQLLEPTTLGALSNLIGDMPAGETLQQRILEESARMLAPYVEAALGVNEALKPLESWESALNRSFLEELGKTGVLRDDALGDLDTALDRVGDINQARQTISEAIFHEMEKRDLSDPEGTRELLIACLDYGDGERIRKLIFESVLPHAPLCSQALVLVDEFIRWQEARVAEATDSNKESIARRLTEIIEQIGVQRLLPADAVERLWELLKIGIGHDGLHREISTAATQHPGPELLRISGIAQSFAKQRDRWLHESSDKMGKALQTVTGLPKAAQTTIMQKARAGGSGDALFESLRSELMKIPPNSEVLKIVRNFAADQTRHAGEVANSLVREMSEWTELSKELRKAIGNALAQYSESGPLKERLTELVRDLPGETAEIPSLINEAVSQVAQWHQSSVDTLVDAISGAAPLSTDALNRLTTLVEQGVPGDRLEEFVSTELLHLPSNESALHNVQSHNDAWAAWLRENGEVFLGELGDIGSEDLQEQIRSLAGEPVPAQQFPQSLVQLAVEDLIGRNLEPLLATENAPAFIEELRRRVPFSKDILGKMKPEQFAGKNKEQLIAHILRLVNETLGSIPVEDFPRTLKTLGWYTEKDEKQRASALSDMGALIAEREIGNPAFPDPDGFAEILLESDVLREDEYQYLTMVDSRIAGDAKAGSRISIVQLINDHLRLEPARRRKVNELKAGEVASLLDQAIKAHALFDRDVHYVVQDGREIVIVDEFTGRLMPGRRWSDGLHEAVEAKHGVEVRLESQTVATITIQNYFRMYYKLAGMTGTARTEEAEFINTYKLEVLSIPTNKPVRRKDHPDMVFKTAEAKFRAITLELLQMHWRGQPVLVGTRSVEISERLSDRLKGPALQLLTLTVLIKTKLWEAEKSAAKDREATIAQLNVPLPQLNVTHVRNLAKELGISVEVTSKENIDKLESLLENGPGSRDRLITALRNGIPHNVLNAKNHKNEARIIAEAARIGAITIATNMAGRGVDIVLGGTLDEEAKIRVITGQIIAHRIKGEFARLRSRTDETTAKLLQRLTPPALQDLCWCLTVQDAVSQLQADRRIDSYQTKELFDSLAVSLDSSATRSSKESEVRNRVRSRARRLNCADALPLEDEVLTEERLRAFARQVNVQPHQSEALKTLLTEGVPAYVYQSDVPERSLIQVLLRQLNAEKQRYRQLLKALPQVRDLDQLLLEEVAWGDHQLNEVPDPGQLESRLAEHHGVAGVTREWVRHRLEAFDIVDVGAARERLSGRASEEIEVNDRQILELVRKTLGGSEGNGAPDLEWIHEKLRGLNIIRSERKYVDDTEESEAAVMHYRIDRDALGSLSFESDKFEAHLRGDVIVGALRGIDPQAPWASLEWVDHRLWALQILQGPQEVRTITLPAESEDDGAPPVETPVYRISGNRLLPLMEQPLLEATVHRLGDRPHLEVSVEDLSTELTHRQPLIEDYVNDQWILKRLTEWKVIDPGIAKSGRPFTLERKRLPTVLAESGVSGQSADWVLAGDKRPEDVIQTSEYHEVKALGGLHVLGTERHESRRIDNQLRGRSGRQGDPGTSRFYVSWEDELIRLFASPPKFLLDRWYEDEAIAAGVVTKSIERAQKKVEINHFEARKHTLEYDDVMNIQRDVIYKERRKALLGGNLRDRVLDMIDKTVSVEVLRFASPQVSPVDWDLHRLYQSLSRLMGVCRLSDYLKEEELDRKGAAEIQELCVEAFRKAYEFREEDLTHEMMRELERLRVCEAVDEYWMQHLAEMDSMREGINLRAYGQREPLLEYRREAFELFRTMMESIQRDVTEYLFLIPTEAVREFAQQRHQLRLRSMQMRRGEDEAVATTTTFTREGGTKVGRNNPCPCGSGKKYKKCCMLKEEAA